MTTNLTLRGALSAEEAAGALQARAGAMILAGGTDLIPLVKDDIATPDTLVDISGASDLSGVEVLPGEIRIGALTSLSTVMADPELSKRAAALVDACRLAASPQLRNMGTLGGNLLQQTRCWYYRGQHNCWLKGGDTCFARDGENEYHAVFMTESPCVSAHPSDPAVALLALDAGIRYVSGGAEHEAGLESIFALPSDERRNFVALPADAVITRIVVPAAPPGARSIYLKAMPRATWAFALVGLALYLDVADDHIRSVRVAVGAAAPIPFRARRVEELMTGQRVSGLERQALADLLIADTRPLTQNGYKLPLLQALFTEALEQLTR